MMVLGMSHVFTGFNGLRLEKFRFSNYLPGKNRSGFGLPLWSQAFTVFNGLRRLQIHELGPLKTVKNETYRGPLTKTRNDLKKWLIMHFNAYVKMVITSSQLIHFWRSMAENDRRSVRISKKNRFRLFYFWNCEKYSFYVPTRIAAWVGSLS